MRASASWRAVSMMIGTDDEVRMKRARSNPVSPGIITSRIKRSKCRPSSLARAASVRSLQPGSRFFLCGCAAGPQDCFQHLVGIVMIDHRAQELPDRIGAGWPDVRERAVDAGGLRARHLPHQRLAL